MVNFDTKAIPMGIGIGLLAGLTVAIGGAIKDSPMEGFKPFTFLRSPIIGLIVGAIIAGFFPKTSKPVLYIASIGAERAVVETWKIVRVQIPGKFTHGEWGMKRPVITETIPLQSCGCNG